MPPANVYSMRPSPLAPLSTSSRSSSQNTNQPVARTRNYDKSRIERLVQQQHRESERLRALREEDGPDDEERAILQYIEDRNNNRRMRHAVRRTVNTRVRRETNEVMTNNGLLGLSPKGRIDSVIAWDTSVKTPTREKAERMVPMPSTPTVHHQIFSIPSDRTRDLTNRVQSLLTALEAEKRPASKKLLVDRLASEFSSLFHHLHSDDIVNQRPVTCLKILLELEALRVLRANSEADDITFFIDALLKTIPNLSAILSGRIPFPDPNNEGLSDTLSTPTHKRRLLTPRADGLTKKEKGSKSQMLWLPNDEEFYASIKAVSSTFLATTRDNQRR